VRGLGAAVLLLLVLLLLVLLLLSAACSPTSVLNAVAPRDGVTLTRDVPYQDGLRHMLDVYAPRPTATPASQQQGLLLDADGGGSFLGAN
jgi:hypothetical protein